ncbi:hypothetical protein [Pseudoduganella rivuli]|nr:hypothetical protein [Pseudoduganella rivuli]
MNERLMHWLLAAVLAAVSAWALWAIRQPEFAHLLASLMPLC